MRQSSMVASDHDGCDCHIDASQITQTERDIQDEMKRREDEEKFFHQNKYKRPTSPNKERPLYRDNYEAWRYDKYTQEAEE